MMHPVEGPEDWVGIGWAPAQSGGVSPLRYPRPPVLF